MSAGAIGGASGAAAATSSGAFGELSSDEFVKIMISELSNQDPLEPQDSGALLEQLSSLRNIESQLSLQESLDALIQQNTVVQASSLVGKTVEYDSETLGRTTAAEVTSVQINGDEVSLKLDNGVTMPISKVTGVSGGLNDAGSGEDGSGDNANVINILEALNKVDTTGGPLSPLAIGAVGEDEL